LSIFDWQGKKTYELRRNGLRFWRELALRLDGD
jgi:hypothetical protein